MATNDAQETLDRILADLQSDDSTRQLAALHEFERLRYSSQAIFRELERLALGAEGAVQKFALAELSSRASQFVASQLSSQTKSSRHLILQEIDTWQKDGLIEPPQAEVIRRRYDFDTKRTASVQPPVEGKLEPAAVHEANMEDVEKAQIAQIPASTGPRPSLTQTLLSEASIKIYLYLGAFFVIASALILAALVQAARLPILAAATIAFGGSSVFIRRRLPQPSFALFIVFSFLLPIDANVFEETVSLVEPSLSVYWTVVFLIMAAIWGFSIWFYESRFFSLVAFVSLSLAFYRAGQIFNTKTELQIFLIMLASLAGLAVTFVLRKWKDNKFSLPIFLVAQLQVLGLLAISLVFVAIHIFDSDISGGWWILVVATWLAAASFYVLSDLLTPTVFFSWMAVGALLPIPWFLLNAFHVTQPIYALGFWSWGTVLVLTSEVTFRLSQEKIRKYYWALLAGSAPLFLVAVIIALDWDQPGFTFAVFALIALVYVALHVVRPRWYVWSAGLLSALSAYFLFFQLPTIEKLNIHLISQLLMAGILLVSPELFTRSALSLKSQSRWPALVFGVFISGLCLSLALTDFDHTGRAAVILVVYAALFTLHALHSRYTWLGYFAIAAEVLAVLYGLNHFKLDLWLPALTLLSVIYYATGFFFRRGADELKSWGNVLINSGLVVGALLCIASLVLVKETSGLYIVVIAFSFAVELFARPFSWLELMVEILLSMALYRILDDFNAGNIEHFLFGASIVWLGCDLIFHYFIKEKRAYRPIVLSIGSLLTVTATFTLWDKSNPIVPTIYFSVYAAFFTAYALLQNEARVGYVAAAYLALSLAKLCDTINFEKWIFPLIALAIVYYLSGYWLRRNQKASDWEEILLYSGLGLSVLTSIAGPFQGGLDASLPIALAGTLFAIEAFTRRNAWWALPANLLYLLSYFMILLELNVDEPQFYSIGTALLGMLMHYLLTHAGSKTGAFIAGMSSQLVLLGTTYIQMVSTEKLSFFFVLFIQSMIVLLYGLLQRSRSLVITPIVFAVIGVMTVIYSALKGLGPVILIGSTGVLLLTAGIIAVLMRERITRLGEQLSEWKP